jgi:6-phosphofructokinase 1
MSKKIGFINSGGDCPGLNTVMDAVVRSLHGEYEILGFKKGYEGLLEKDYIQLTPDLTSVYKFQGGTLLKSTNHGNFAVKFGVNQTASLDPEIIKKTVENYKELNLEGLITLGGDGSLAIAEILSNHGINIVAVPKSIDNDLFGTDFTFGFQTAVSIASDALDRLETTAYSHDRVMILEVMGRNAGWIALFSGIAGGANMILIPEIPFSKDKVYNFLKKRHKKNAVIVIAEGAKAIDDELVLKNFQNKGKSESLLGGVGEQLAIYLNSFEGIEVRSTALGHIQRGGSPSPMDRVLSRLYGVYAANLFKQKKFSRMVAYTSGVITDIPISTAISKIKNVDPNGDVVNMAKNMGINFGD